SGLPYPGRVRRQSPFHQPEGRSLETPGPKLPEQVSIDLHVNCHLLAAARPISVVDADFVSIPELQIFNRGVLREPAEIERPARFLDWPPFLRVPGHRQTSCRRRPLRRSNLTSRRAS